MTSPWRSSLLIACAGCATAQMPIDPELAANAEVLQPRLETDVKSSAVKLGQFTLEYLQPITSSTIRPLNQPPFSTHRFAFELKNQADEAWDVSCDVRIRWVDDDPDDSIRELSCAVTNSEGKLPYRLSMSGTGPMLGLMSGSLNRGSEVLSIDSAHGTPIGSRTVGPLLGFDISQNHRLLGRVQVVDPLTIWIDKRFPEELRALAAACAVALSFYDEVGRS